MSSLPSPLPESTPLEPSNLLTIPRTLRTAIDDYNRRFCYIREGSVIAEIDPTRTLNHKIRLLKPTTFIKESYNTDKVGERRVASAWFDSKTRTTAERLVYEPGQPRFFQGNLNTWFPPDITPIRGDISLFHEYLEKMFSKEPTFLPWFRCWLAYPLQHPGTKLFTASLIWSRQQGNGKSTLGWIMRHLYGKHNSALIKEGQIGYHFNAWAARKQFIDVDEMHGDNAKRKSEELKTMITRDEAEVNEKYQPQYTVRDTLNYYFSTNSLSALHIDAQDRRFFIHNCDDCGLTQKWVSDTLHKWLSSPPALPAILHYLQHEIDLTQPISGGDPFSTSPAPFRPRGIAPRTHARAAMIRDGKSDLDAWLEDFAESPDLVFDNTHPWMLFTSASVLELYTFLRPTAQRESHQSISKALATRFVRMNNGNAIRYLGNQSCRLFGVPRNGISTETLANWDHSSTSREYEKELLQRAATPAATT